MTTQLSYIITDNSDYIMTSTNYITNQNHIYNKCLNYEYILSKITYFIKITSQPVVVLITQSGSPKYLVVTSHFVPSMQFYQFTIILED